MQGNGAELQIFTNKISELSQLSHLQEEAKCTINITSKLSQLSQEEAKCTMSIISKVSQLSQEEAKCTSIYKVHHHLRNVNDKAYEPEIISIGPYHRDKTNLIMMEEHKLRYLQWILDPNNIDGVSRRFRKLGVIGGIAEFVSVITPLERKARKCYAEPISLSPTEFVEMLILDGCFIIELLRKYDVPMFREKNDTIFHMDWILNSLQRDLILFENQIPFFVLCQLFDLVEAPKQYSRLNYLAFNFFHSMNPGKNPQSPTEIESLEDIKHLLHLIYMNWYNSPRVFKKDASPKGRSQSIDTATNLREANVKFESKEEFSLHNVSFAGGTISLPHLIVEDRTETLLRNMIAYEQYFQENDQNPLTDYVMLLDWLINSWRDIEILCHSEIIENLLGDNVVAAKVFNKLTESVTGPREIFIYDEVFKKINQHCNINRNKWMAKLRHNYLNSPWAILSIVVGIIVLLLTVIQSVCSVLQIV